MRSFAPWLLLLSVACATMQAPSSSSSASSTQTAAASPALAAPAPMLPLMEPPAAPPPGWLPVSRAYALMENDPARALLQHQQAWFEGNRKPNTLYDAACTAARLGRKAEAMAWLERAVDNGYRDAHGLRTDADLMSLRGEKAFNDLLAKIPKLPPPVQEKGANPELLRLVTEDQADRQNMPETPTPAFIQEFRERDRQRRLRVDQMLATGAATTGADFHAAALIFQHGDTLEDYARARELAAEAARRGHPAALRLTALAWDRWLMKAGQPQRFGTQYMGDPATGQMNLYPVDPSVTDAERARWGIQPLAEIPQRM